MNSSSIRLRYAISPDIGTRPEATIIKLSQLIMVIISLVEVKKIEYMGAGLTTMLS